VFKNEGFDKKEMASLQTLFLVGQVYIEVINNEFDVLTKF